MELVFENKKELDDFGLSLASELRSGDLISLSGDLGAGKTTLTQSICRGLGVEDYVTSPTFALLNEYRFKDSFVYHFDIYRLENIDEVDDLGFDEYFFGNGISIVEWGEKIEEFLPENSIRIRLDYEGDGRRVRISEENSREKELVEVLSESFGI